MRLRFTAVAVCSGAFVLGWVGLTTATPDSVRGFLPLDPATPYIHFIPDSLPIATAILVHGLNSNKEFMQTFAMALTDAGVETYIIDLPGHGDSSLPFNYRDSLRAVEALLDMVKGSAGNPIVVGHSMGGALLIDLAPERGFETMLLLSPAPIPLADFPNQRLLVVTGALEAPRINQFVPEVIEAAGGETLWWKFPDAAHSTALFHPAKIRQMVEWVIDSEDGEAPLRTMRRYGWLMLTVLAAITYAAALARRRGNTLASPPYSTPVAHTLVSYVVASVAVVGLLRFINPMAWMGAFATDYLIGFILVVGLLLWRARGCSFTGRSMAVSLIAAAYVIGVGLVGIGGHLVDLVPSGIQWLWFPALTVAGLPLFLHDEQTLRPIPIAWKRWGTFLLTRLILWAGVVTGVLFLNTENSFLVLIMHFVVVFWLLLWWTTGFIARRTGHAGAAALFAAIVHAWALAALIVRV